MGSCISKCTKSKRKFKRDSLVHVQDKLVISQDPIPPEMITMPPKTSSSTTTTTTSSFSCSTDSHNTDKCATASSSTASSSSSSLLSAKDRSFSDEFLWSCVKDNPQVISLKDKQFFYHHPQNLHPSSLASPLLTARSTNHIPTPKKRARASSPTLARQKSFRKEQDHNTGLPNRALSSPSPSRRFNNSSYPKRETFRANPDNLIGRDPSSKRIRGNLISKQVSTRIDDRVAVGDSRDVDVVMEDINNPLIALDCFIFL